MHVAIRPMTIADTSTVGEVHVRAWQSAYRGVMPDDYLDGLRPGNRADMWRALCDQPAPRQLVSRARTSTAPAREG